MQSPIKDVTQARVIDAGSEDHIIYIARVSSNQDNTDPGLLAFLIRQNHWSPFEMVGATIEIETTRDIGRQILRHRSFSFQEFSQRYAAVERANFDVREMRLSGTSNRQGSLDDRQPEAERAALALAEQAFQVYRALLDSGVAPECARAVLPEGFAPTRMYMNGTLRSWIHYLRERCKLDTLGRPYAQREHYRLAREIETLLAATFPVVFAALAKIDYIDQPLVGEE